MPFPQAWFMAVAVTHRAEEYQARNRPITGVATTANSSGYWLVASDGGIFDFSNFPFHGSLAAHPPASPIVSVATTS